jgi:hypothetical protein
VRPRWHFWLTGPLRTMGIGATTRFPLCVSLHLFRSMGFLMGATGRRPAWRVSLASRLGFRGRGSAAARRTPFLDLHTYLEGSAQAWQEGVAGGAAAGVGRAVRVVVLEGVALGELGFVGWVCWSRGDGRARWMRRW